MRVGGGVNIFSLFVEVDRADVVGVVALVVLIQSAVVEEIVKDDFFDVFVEGDLVLKTDDAGRLFLVIFEPGLELTPEDGCNLILDLLIQHIITHLLKIVLPLIFIPQQEAVIPT